MLSFTPDLEKAIAEARDHLHAHHAIEAGQRQAIYGALGSWGEDQLDTVGYRRRARLALLSAHYVLPLIERLIPSSRSKDMLLLAEQILTGQRSRLELQVLFLSQGRSWRGDDLKRFNDLVQMCPPLGNLTLEDASFTVEEVSMAALITLSVALFDDFNFPALQHQRPDVPMESWDDVAGWAWVAYRDQAGLARGHEALRNGDTFYKWWLHQAIPLAWSSV